MMRIPQFLTVVAVCALSAGVALASDSDMVIIQSYGTPLPAGAVIDGAKEVELSSGAEIMLIAQSGAQIALSGPFKGQPFGTGVGGGDGGVVSALAGLLSKFKASTASLGAVRSAGQSKGELPSPWVVDITEDATSCVMEGSQPVLWRGSAGDKESFHLSEENGVWTGKVVWPAGDDRLKMPEGFAFKENRYYGAKLESGEKRLIRVLAIPADLNNDAVRAAWMSRNGCEKQALALLKAM